MQATPGDTVAVLGGTGDQGMGLVLRWARAGKRILIGSRSRERAEQAAAQARSRLGENVRVEGMEYSEAVAHSPLVVLTVPFEAQIRTLAGLKDAFHPGQLLVDVTVPLETAVGGSASRVLGVWAGSAAEQAARHVPVGVEVVAAFQNVPAHSLQDLEHGVECDVIVCGNSSEAKKAVSHWVEAIPGCRYVDGGRLENARIVEAMTALLVGINVRYKVRGAGLRISGLPPC